MHPLQTRCPLTLDYSRRAVWNHPRFFVVFFGCFWIPGYFGSFAVQLRTCFVVYETSPDFQSAWAGGDDDWIFISRWTYPLMQDRVAQGWISPMTLTWGQLWMRQPSVVHSGPELLLALCTLIQVSLLLPHNLLHCVFISQLLLLLSAIISFRKGMNYSSQKSALPLLCKAGSSKFGSCFNRPCSSGQGI